MIYSCSLSEENRGELARFAKNFLPILFNMYTTDNSKGVKDNKRLAVLETVKSYLKICDKQVICGVFYAVTAIH